MVKKRNFTNAFLEDETKNEPNDVTNEIENDINIENKDNNEDTKESEVNTLPNEQINQINIPNVEVEQVEVKNTTEIVSKENEPTQVIQKTTIEDSISGYVKNKLNDTKKRMDLFYGNTTAFGKTTKKPKFSEMYSGVTVSMNRDLNEILEYLVTNSTYNKTQLLELLIITGLENISFD